MQFLDPRMMLLAIPLSLIAWLLIRREFLKLPEDREFQIRKIIWRRWILVSRILIILLVCVALARPFVEVSRETSGDPRITVVIDNSTSMEMFDMSFMEDFMDALGDDVPLTIRYTGSEERSDIGEGLLANIEHSSNILLISDGNNNAGTNLGDVSLFASATNSTISSLQIEPEKKDVGVSILGPSKVVKDLNSSFLVRVTNPNVGFYHITVSIDGVPVIDADTDKTIFYVDEKFTRAGYHTLQAVVSFDGKDHFPQNNEFYKVVNVIDKPKILYITQKGSPLEVIMNKLYSVDKVSTLPENIEKYYAVVINDMPAEKFRKTEILSQFLIEGGGLVVFGGFNSFDRGNYKNSLFEQLLPVKIGNAERKFGDNTIVLSIDRSKGGGKCRTIIDLTLKTKEEVCSNIAYIDVIKAQAIEVIGQLDVSNRVGAVAFDTGTYLIEPLDYLYNNQERLEEKIKRIQPGADALVSKGILGGYNLLSNEKGNRYIILLTDGLTWIGDQEESVGLTGNLFKQNIKVISVGIGRSVQEDFLRSAAANGGGFYVSAGNKGKLKVLFGDPEKKDQGNDFPLFVVNTGHFITRNIDPDAVLKGYNQVLPRSSAELLVTTDTGEPALTVWRYGLGKVATWNVFTGSSLGDLLNEKNSLILTRTVNWAIGDPERKKDYFVNVIDGRTNEVVKVQVKSAIIPSAEGLNFVKVDRELYETTLFPDDTGFGNVLDAKYAVNYPREYEETGFNPELEAVVKSTGGNLFKAEDVDSIIEFVKSVSRRTVVEKTILIWPFVLGAILIFLVEVMLRRISENRRINR